MKTKIVRSIFALMLALSVLGISASAALADQPPKGEWIFENSVVANDLCSFPVTVNTFAYVTEHDYLDKNGVLLEIKYHFRIQDTFLANGKTLVGLWYTANLQYLFDSSGNMIQLITSGEVEKVPLPDGSLFISAGRSYLDPNTQFVATPDRGHSGNVEALCAALAP